MAGLGYVTASALNRGIHRSKNILLTNGNVGGLFYMFACQHDLNDAVIWFG